MWSCLRVWIQKTVHIFCVCGLKLNQRDNAGVLFGVLLTCVAMCFWAKSIQINILLFILHSIICIHILYKFVCLFRIYKLVICNTLLCYIQENSGNNLYHDDIYNILVNIWNMLAPNGFRTMITISTPRSITTVLPKATIDVVAPCLKRHK